MALQSLSTKMGTAKPAELRRTQHLPKSADADDNKQVFKLLPEPKSQAAPCNWLLYRSTLYWSMIGNLYPIATYPGQMAWRHGAQQLGGSRHDASQQVLRGYLDISSVRHSRDVEPRTHDS